MEQERGLETGLRIDSTLLCLASIISKSLAALDILAVY